MYYIIETNYVGPNRAEGRYLDSEKSTLWMDRAGYIGGRPPCDAAA